MNTKHFFNTSKIDSNIDYSTQIGNATIITGWCAFQTDKKSEIVVEDENGNEIRNVSICFGNRQDVLNHYKDSSIKKECGFVIVLTNTENSAKKFKLTFKIESNKTKVWVEIKNKSLLQDVFNHINHFSDHQKQEVKTAIQEKSRVRSTLEKKYKSLQLSDSGLKLHLDKFVILESGIFIYGWIDDYSSNVTGLYVKHAGVLSSNMYPSLQRKLRPDVNSVLNTLPSDYKIGFYCYFPLEKRVSDTIFELLILIDDQHIVQIPFQIPVKINSQAELTEEIFSTLHLANDDINALFETHISGAINAIWNEKRTLNLNNIIIKEFGKPIKDPKVSIIVPIYGRIDFIMYQLSQFSNDPDFESTELIYVLDDPKLEASFYALCSAESTIYNIHFKTVYNGKNNGFGGANNLGAHVAIGKKLILLNSDVMPSEKGWITSLISHYDTVEKPGVIGAKLVYEDHSIQHLGMNFYYNHNFKIYMNEHPGKGLPERLFESFNIKKTNLVTAACVMIDKALFNSIGGFNLDYILGDFEDSDLCLRLIELGYTNYIAGNIKLYHLERQSQNLVKSGDWKQKLTVYNGWQQQNKWKQLIETLINQPQHVEA